MIASLIGNNNTLTSLNVCKNNITGVGAQELAAAAFGKQTLNTFCQIPLKELRSDKLTNLDLSAKGIGVPGALVLAELIRTFSSSLTSLDVGFNLFGKDAALELVSTFRDKQMATVGLARCSLDANAVKVVAEYVRVSSSLTSLDLGFNGIGSEATLELVSTFKEKQMASVGLARCGLDANATKIVAEYARVSESLTEVNLDGFALPVKKLKGTEPVERLDFSGRGLGVDSAIVIASLIGVNATLTLLK